MNKKEEYKKLLSKDCKIDIEEYLKLTDEEILQDTKKFIKQMPEFERIHWYLIREDNSQTPFKKFIGIFPGLKERPFMFSFIIESDNDLNDVKNTIRKIFKIFGEDVPEGELEKIKYDANIGLKYFNKGLSTEENNYGAGIRIIYQTFELGY